MRHSGKSQRSAVHHQTPFPLLTLHKEQARFSTLSFPPTILEPLFPCHCSTRPHNASSRPMLLFSWRAKQSPILSLLGACNCATIDDPISEHQTILHSRTIPPWIVEHARPIAHALRSESPLATATSGRSFDVAAVTTDRLAVLISLSCPSTQAWSSSEVAQLEAKTQNDNLTCWRSHFSR